MNRFIEKFTSGKFLFTCVAAVLMYRGTINGMFPPDQVLGIIKDVVIFYFIVKKTIGK